MILLQMKFLTKFKSIISFRDLYMSQILFMKKITCNILTVLLIFLAPSALYSQNDDQYVFDKSIALPGDGGYDYLYIDQAGRKLYVSHGTTVNVLDLNSEKLIGTVENMQGVHGIAVVKELNRGFISDGKANSVAVFDLENYKLVGNIPVSGKKPDAITYDPFSNHVFTFNGGSNNASVIDVVSLKEMGIIDLGGAPEFGVPDGQGKIFNNLEDKNRLNVIDTRSLKVIGSYPLSPCGGPTGLALDPVHKRLFTGCRENKGMSVLDAVTGKIITTLPIGAGVDAVAYDQETGLIFCSNGDATTTIIKQESADNYKVVQTLSTQTRAKTLALDTQTHKIYLSVVDFEKGTRNPVTGSFKVMVFKLAH